MDLEKMKMQKAKEYASKQGDFEYESSLEDFIKGWDEAIAVTSSCKSDSEQLKCEHKYGQLKDGIYTCFDCGHKEEW